MVSSFQKQSQKISKIKIGDLTKIRILPFLHKAATISERKKLKCNFLAFSCDLRRVIVI